MQEVCRYAAFGSVFRRFGRFGGRGSADAERLAGLFGGSFEAVSKYGPGGPSVTSAVSGSHRWRSTNSGRVSTFSLFSPKANREVFRCSRVHSGADGLSRCLSPGFSWHSEPRRWNFGRPLPVRAAEEPAAASGSWVSAFSAITPRRCRPITPPASTSTRARPASARRAAESDACTSRLSRSSGRGRCRSRGRERAPTESFSVFSFQFSVQALRPRLAGSASSKGSETDN
jgi:hypothetical protein